MAFSAHSNVGKWMALIAALLGWLFDGLEMGLFPLVARPALDSMLREELPEAPDSLTAAERESRAEQARKDLDERINTWLGVITAFFLVGAATGGVLFGWLGDRIGRVKAMMLSVLTYAIVSGLGGLVTNPWQLGILRFIAALGMGGEWSLGVALINEIWPGRSRAFLAGLIGAAANVGYLLIAWVGGALTSNLSGFETFLLDIGFSESLTSYLVADQGWRVLMISGAFPALLTFFIRVFVPESAKWEAEKAKGATSHWANRDLLGVLVGCAGAFGIITLWAIPLPLFVSIAGTLICLTIVTVGYVVPLVLYLQRAEEHGDVSPGEWKPTLRIMLLAAALSGVALLGTWGTVQQAPTYAANVVRGENMAKPVEERLSKKELAKAEGFARSSTQLWSAFGAIIGTIIAALVAGWLGRRITYFFLCLGSLAIVPAFFLTTETVDAYFLFLMFLAGAITAAFYGWLPLYLPELFKTKVRATGQGFGFNFGRVIASIGVLQLGPLTRLLGGRYGWDLRHVCSVLALIYVIGMMIIWLAPETKGKPLPE